MSVAAPVSSSHPSADLSQSPPPATAGRGQSSRRSRRPTDHAAPAAIGDRCRAPCGSWAFDNVLATAPIDSVSMLFPAGERFFVRSVHHYQQQRKPPPAELKAQIQGFFAQEGRHAQQHERLNRVLVCRGYDVSGFSAPLRAHLLPLHRARRPAGFTPGSDGRGRAFHGDPG